MNFMLYFVLFMFVFIGRLLVVAIIEAVFRNAQVA